MRKKLLIALGVLLVLLVVNLAVIVVMQWRHAAERERYVAQLEEQRAKEQQAPDATLAPPPQAPRPPPPVQQLLQAIGRNNVEQIRALLDAHPGLLNATNGNQYNNTPLHFAAYNNLEEIAAELLQRGAEVNAVNRHGNTPLHDAITAGNQPIVRMLLDRRANVHLKTSAKKDPAAYAEEMKQTEIVEMIRKHEQTASAR